MKRFSVVSLAMCSMLAACATPGEESRPDVYDQSAVNQAQQQRVVNIVLVTPAHINADNTHNHNLSTGTGALIGGGLGAGLGTAFGGGLAGGLAGLGGAAIGGAAGSQIQRDHAIVSGVTITYDDPRAVGTQSSTQVGRSCEYKKGQALLVLTAQNETRVQPNAECPVKK